ncbi:elongation of very long chain fatty acids protein, partial [Neobacillus cucumis]|uniref:elongation of very long chain fatty acids protein n=1 Tax=Neobacillus cucumis TaxID=1740721 RepID=UPI00360A34CA
PSPLASREQCAALATMMEKLLLAAALSACPASASLASWMPDAATIYQDLTYKPSPEEERMLVGMNEFKGMHFRWKPALGHWSEAAIGAWPTWTANNWWISLSAVAIYFMAIPTLKWVVARYGKWNVRNAAFYWNAFLSIFSWCGVLTCVPVMVQTLFEHGLYFTCCAPATWYGAGYSGLFVAFFIYSKVAELIDTVLLLLAAKPVIALQWWHHSTVLLYCWHSYSCRIATGLWFAAMNYSVHSVMYGYFALMTTQYRKYITPYAIFITLAQLAQMLVGMFVTIKAVMYQDAGLECHVNKTNSVLGLMMYFSYFVLFFKLFIENYVTQTRKRFPAAGLP